MGTCYSDKSRPISGDLSDSSSSSGMPVTGSDRAARPKSGLPRPKSYTGQSKSGQNEKKSGIAKIPTASGREGKMGATHSKASPKYGVKFKGSGITGPDTRTHKSASCSSLNNNDIPCAVAQIIGDDIRMIDDESDIVNANLRNGSPRISSRQGSRKNPNGEKAGTTPKSCSAIIPPKQFNHFKSKEKSQLKRPQTLATKDGVKHGIKTPSPENKGMKKSQTELRKTGIATASSQNMKQSGGNGDKPEKANPKGVRVFKGLRFGGASKKNKTLQNELVQGEVKKDKVKKCLPRSEITAPLARMDSVSLSSCNRTPCASLVPSPAEENVPLPNGIQTTVLNVNNENLTNNTQHDPDLCDGEIVSSTPLTSKTKQNDGADLNNTYTQDECKGDYIVKDTEDSVIIAEVNAEPILNVTFDMTATTVMSEQSGQSEELADPLNEHSLPVSDAVVKQVAAPLSASKPRAKLVSQTRLHSVDCESLGSLHSDDLMLDLELDEFEDLPYESSETTRYNRPRAHSKDSAEAEAAADRRGRGVIVRRYTDGGLQKRHTGRRRGGSLKEQLPLQELSTLVDRQPVIKLREREKTGNARPASYPGSMIGRPRSISVDTPLQENSTMFRQRRQLSLADDSVVQVDAASYRQMVQELTTMKTLLLKLKRSMQEDGLSSPFTPTAPKVPGFSQEALTEKKSEKNVEKTVENMAEKNEELEQQVQTLQEELQQQSRTIHLLQQQMTKYECSTTHKEKRDVCEVGVQSDLLITQTTIDSGLASPDQNDHNSTFTISQVTDEDEVTQLEVTNIMASSGGSADFIETDLPTDINKNMTAATHTRIPLDNNRLNKMSGTNRKTRKRQDSDSPDRRPEIFNSVSVSKVRNVKSKLSQPKHYEMNDNDNKGMYNARHVGKGVKRAEPGRGGVVEGGEHRPITKLPRSKLAKFSGLPRPATVSK